MSSESEKEKAKTDSSDDMSLSAALLAPLNSIFEAQIHAARAFLNFIMQMGFRHRYTDEEKSRLRQMKDQFKADSEDAAEIQKVLGQIELEEQTKREIQSVIDKAERREPLSEDESWRLQDYYKEHGDLYQQCIRYVDNTGRQRKIYIPNLALLPVQPLSIDSAKFNFEMYVSDASKTYDQMGTVPGAKGVERPWFLIKPRSIRGDITSSKASESSKTIKIEMNVKSGDMPYGLHKLLSSLTDIADDIENKSLPNK